MHSSSKCNTRGVEKFDGSSEAERLSGPCVEFHLGLLELILGDGMKRLSFWEVLSDEAVGIFIEASFPGGVRMSEEELGLEFLSDALVEGELFAVVRCECEDEMAVRPEGLNDRVSDQISFGCFDMSQDEHFGFPFHHGNQSSLPSFPEDGVQFPVSDSRFLVNDRRPLVDADGVLDSPSPAFGFQAFTPLFPAEAEVVVEVTALALVSVDELVDGLVTDPRPAFSSESSTDLLRTPSRSETVGNDELERVGEADVLSTFSLAFDREGVGLFVPVASLAGVAPNLSTHGRGMHFEEFCDAAHRVAFFP